MPHESSKIEYFLYARKSSEDDDRQVQSIPDQQKRLMELAKRLGIKIIDVLEESKSAKTPNGRSVFNKMLERIEKGEAQGILCWQLNRLTRNPVDSGRISWMLQQGIIQAIQTIDREYHPDDNVILFNVETGEANQFIINLRKNTMRGMLGKTERGVFPGLAPMGYLNDRIEHTIIEDADRFDLVRKMWDMMLTGNFTPNQIREIANKKWGFRTVKRKKSGGVEISLSVMYKLFSNIFYTGQFKWGGKVSQGTHKPMITLEEFDRVQELLGRKGRPRPKIHAFAYTGIMRCAVCGSAFTAIEKTKLIKKTGKLKKFVFYYCTRRKKGIVCNQTKYLTLEDLETQAEMLMERYTIHPQFRKWALEILARDNDKEITDRTKVYETQHKALVTTQAELDNLTRMCYRGLIDEDAFRPESEKLKSKIKQLQQNLRQTEDRAEKWVELTELTFNFATYARKAFVLGDLQAKREIFSALGENFFVKDRKLALEKSSWFVLIEKAYPKLFVEFNRLELNKNLTVKQRSEAKANLILIWGESWELNP